METSDYVRSLYQMRVKPAYVEPSMYYKAFVENSYGAEVLRELIMLYEFGGETKGFVNDHQAAFNEGQRSVIGLVIEKLMAYYEQADPNYQAKIENEGEDNE